MVLAIASKFFRPDFYLPLLSHGKTLINRAISTGESDPGLIQALAIAVYWKEPSDKSVWLKIGTAIRMACQLGWHLGPKRPLPTDHVEARKQVVRLVFGKALVADGQSCERVWFCLICESQLPCVLPY